MSKVSSVREFDAALQRLIFGNRGAPCPAPPTPEHQKSESPESRVGFGPRLTCCHKVRLRAVAYKKYAVTVIWELALGRSKLFWLRGVRWVGSQIWSQRRVTLVQIVLSFALGPSETVRGYVCVREQTGTDLQSTALRRPAGKEVHWL